MTTITAISAIISLLILGIALFLLKKKTGGSITTELEEKSKLVHSAISEINTLVSQTKNIASKGQLENLTNRLDESKTALVREKELLKEIEGKLENVQKMVETKEVHHQEMKSAKEEDESKLSELLACYDDISQEAIGLEQKLAASLKSLDSMMVGIELTAEQKQVLEELSNTLTEAGSRMRDLLTEYSMVKERLDGLKGQHHDLEEEYTRLVEQQLGE